MARVKVERSAIFFAVAVFLVSEAVGIFLGLPAKLVVCVALALAYLVALILLRQRKEQFFRDLVIADKATQDETLAVLGEKERNEMLRRLGRELTQQSNGVLALSPRAPGCSTAPPPCPRVGLVGCRSSGAARHHFHSDPGRAVSRGRERVAVFPALW